MTPDLIRERSGTSHHRVAFVELFFDLVFVFAVTQLSHLLLAHLTPAGTAQAAFLLVAIWWAWVYTTWATNWLRPERTAVRLLLFGMMLAGLVLAAALPEAFGARGLPFALAYVALQVGRTAFMVWALRGHDDLRRNFVRILAWMLIAAPLWIGGALAGPTNSCTAIMCGLATEASPTASDARFDSSHIPTPIRSLPDGSRCRRSWRIISPTSRYAVDFGSSARSAISSALRLW